MMIQALRYEPRGQRQRFEPRSQQSREPEQRQIHLHLHLHLQFNLNLRARGRRLAQPTIARVTTIFAAFMGALSMALSFRLMSATSLHFLGPHINLAIKIMTYGVFLGSGAILLGGIPLLVSAWRSTPRCRILLLTPLLFALAWLLHTYLYGVMWGLLPPTLQSFMGAPLQLFLFYAFPLVSTLSINCAIRQAKIPDKWLRFTTIPSFLVVLGMFLMIGGVLLWGGTVLFFLPSVFPRLLSLLALPFHSWLLQLIGMLIVLVVMLRAIFSRSHARAEARPKDASPLWLSVHLIFSQAMHGGSARWEVLF